METKVGGRWAGIGRGLVAAVLLAAAAVPLVAAGAHAQDAPALAIVSPKAGDTVTSDDITVQVTVSNFHVDCTQAGRPDQDGVGHLHAMVDGMTMASLANFYCADTFTISGRGLAPGKHTLIVDLASNTHLDLMDTAQEVEFDFQPTNPQPLPQGEDKGEPGVELVSPTDGATVDATFTVEIKPVNFEPSADLEGKPNVPGYGHYHVFVDTPMMGEMSMASPAAGMMGSPAAGGEMAMMSMAGMVAMPGTNTFTLDLTAWGPGPHTIWIEPVQNDHTPFETFGHVEFTVTVK